VRCKCKGEGESRGIKKEGERGKWKVLEGKRVRGSRLLIGARGWKGGVEEVRDVAMSQSAPLNRGRRGRGEEEGAPTGGADVPATPRKRKRRRGTRPLQEGERWAGGPARLKGGVRSFFSFSFFKLFLKNSNFFNSNFIQTFSIFFTKFCRLFKPHTSNQNHA
jgi:hypothetical protein